MNHAPKTILWTLTAVAALTLSAAHAQTAAIIKGKTAATSPPLAASSSSELAVVGPALELIIGKSTLMRLPSAIERISVGNPSIADVSLISPTELYLLGKAHGSTNLLIWRKGGATTAIDVNVSIDSARMEKKLRELMPDETGIRVRPAADSVILTGVVSSAAKAKYAEDIANAFVRDINRSLDLPVTAGDAKVKAGSALAIKSDAGGQGDSKASAKVINLLQIAQAQQVMLEVKIAEVSKSLIDKLGASAAYKRTSSSGENVFSMMSNFLSNGNGLVEALRIGKSSLIIDGQNDDGLVRILAEPNIMAVSGQSASFLSGGKIFIPVSRSTDIGGNTVTLEEKEFGIGVRFTPTVLDGTRINLKLLSEVSDLSQAGSPFTTVNGVVSVLPSLTVRRADTTVQLNDGQSFVIAGLIKNNSTTAIKRFPGLGEVPMLGALFRSSEFQKDQTELLFVITPRLVKPLSEQPTLPTSNHIEPTRADVLINGRAEGTAPAPAVTQ
jgi:pilus assembly protein CpaC